MSYEKKIKDLLGRLVSMSPEASPYPEEAPLAGNDEPRRRPHPVLVFVAGAALVAAVMVPVLLLAGGDLPVGAGLTTTSTMATLTSTTSVQPTTTAVETTTTTSPSPSTTLEAEDPWESIVYLITEPENSFLGHPALIPIRVEVNDPSGELKAGDYFTKALSRALDLGGELPPGLGTVIPDSVEILDVAIDEIAGQLVWVADMNQTFAQGAGGLLADTTMLNQIVYTITEGTPEIDGVVFTVEGEPVTSFGTEAIDLTSPVTRESFIDDLNLIFLTEPISEFEHIYSISGRANTYEAAFTVRVVGANGSTIHEESVMATCGSGCWGEFGVGIGAGLIVPGESSVQLFTYSAEDGSMTDVITVPIPETGVWELSTNG